MTQATVELPPKLIPVFTGDAFVRGAYGGRGSGKTMSFALMTAIRGMMFAEAGIRGIILCGREFMNSLDESSLEEIKHAIRSIPWLEQYYEIGEKYVRTKNGLVEYKFVGLSRNIGSIKSKAKILICWVDEAEPVREETWQVLIPTLRTEYSELWVTWNPASKHSATHKRFRVSEDEDHKVVEVNWSDNPQFPEVLNKQRIKDQRERPDSYDHVWEGAFQDIATGAVYGAEMRKIDKDVRICTVPHQKGFPVYTAWDLGRTDATAVWFWQYVGNEVHVIDYVCDNLRDPDWFASQLLGKEVTIDIVYDQIRVRYGADIEEIKYRQEYEYEKLWLPHDAKAKTFAAKGKSTEELFASVFGWKLIWRTPSLSVQDGIQAARKVLGKCYFDMKCLEGTDALRAYRYEFDEKLGRLKDKPLHDWASNPADAFRYLAIACQEKQLAPPAEEARFGVNQTIDEMIAAHRRKRLASQNY
jgi:phage terminase large subunit